MGNDNPYSESLFKKMKYRSDYPVKKLESLLSARLWVGKFVDWHNHEHRHGSIKFVTPSQCNAGLDAELLKKRAAVYESAKETHPERWSGDVRNWQPIRIVHLNPNQSIAKSHMQKEDYLEDKVAA